jgi:phytoene desaturase
MPAPRIVIIGAGLGGLSTACHLAGAGLDVTVIERDAAPGGRAGRLDLGGYAFDTGPTVLTMVDILAEVFAAAGTTIEDHLTLHRLDPAYRATFADGSSIAVRAGEAAMIQEIREHCGPIEAAAFRRFCAWLRDLHEAEREPFIDRNFDGVLDLVRSPSAGLRLLRLGGFGRLGPRVASFFADDRLRRLFSFQSLYAGLAPQRALALYAIITYMDTVAGVWSVAGGMAAVPRGLAAAAEKAGAAFRYGTGAERIVLAGGDRGPVQGVRLAGGEVVPADVVVSNADVAATYRHLVPGLTPPRAVRRGSWSPSAVVWHAGVRGPLPPGTTHHNIHFGSAWQGAFDDLAGGRLMRDPSTLVSVPTVSDPALAPPDRHVLFALEPVPNLDGRVDWAAARDGVRRRLVERLAAAGYPTAAEVERFVDPTDWAAEGLERGTPFSLSHRFGQTGPFRPANIERRAPGLVLVGAGTTPGVGVPMVLLSGRLAAARVQGLVGPAARPGAKHQEGTR